MNPPDQYGVVGHPISHSWSPFIHGLFARQTDHVVDYKVMDTAPAVFRHAVIDFFVQGGSGANQARRSLRPWRLWSTFCF